MNILVALDPITNSEKVLHKAIEFAKCNDASLTIVSIGETMFDGEGLAQSLGLNEVLITMASTTVEDAKKAALSAGVSASATFLSGPSPANCILEFASDIKADLIVVGSRGKNGLEKYLLGSVAAKVARFSDCSVFIVR
jgi:nucleotide-binding universal stress UspA family protein